MGEKVKTTKRSWREEVVRADPRPEDKTAYVFGGKRVFKDGKGPYGTATG